MVNFVNNMMLIISLIYSISRQFNDIINSIEQFCHRPDGLLVNDATLPLEVIKSGYKGLFTLGRT